MPSNGRKRGMALVLVSNLACLLLSVGAPAARVESYTDLTFSEELTWPETAVKEGVLENGIRFFLVEDHELPLIKVQVQIRTGAVLEPAGREGLADLMAEVMREGGSAAYPAKRLNQFLEDRAAALEIEIDRLSGQASLDVLKKDFPAALPVLVSLLKNPLFPEETLSLAKKQLMTQISRRNDDQDQVGFRELKKIIYGKRSKLARVPEYESVGAVGRDDLVRFHRQTFCGANLRVGVVGDFDPGRMRTMLRHHFSSFQKGERTRFEFTVQALPAKQKWYLAPMPEVDQTFILMGHRGDYRQNPDYATLQVMNNILGGGFSGRLMQEIRTQQGLAYSVFGRYGCKFFYPGMFFVGLKTKSSSTLEAVQAVQKTLSRLTDQGARAEEVTKAKDRFLNSLVFRYDHPEKVLTRRMYYEYRGMPRDSFQTLMQQIKAVKREDLQRVARQYLHPERMRILLVGNEQALSEQISRLEQIERIDMNQ